MSGKKNRELIQDQAGFGGLLGVAILGAFQIISIAQLDRSLTFSLYCFVISIPLLAAYLLNLLGETKYEGLTRHWYNQVCSLIGGLTSLGGLVAVFIHFSWKLGLLFLAVSIISLITAAVHSVRPD